MDIALITGAASGLGLAAARKLIELGYKVYGLGGDYSQTPLNRSGFVPVSCNLGDLAEVENKLDTILEKEGNIHVLVNNAKVYGTRHLEETSSTDLDLVLRINLHLPLLLARKALPGLMKYGGFIINIGATSADLSRGGPLGAATAGGLYWMAQSIFNQYRETGVKVTTLFPQGNQWRPEDVPPPSDKAPQCVIDPEAVAQAIASVVSTRDGNIVTEMVIRPQRVVEKPAPAPLYVPYPKPEPLPHSGREKLLVASTPATRPKVQRLKGEDTELAAEEPAGKNDDFSGRGKKDRKNRRKKREKTPEEAASSAKEEKPVSREPKPETPPAAPEPQEMESSSPQPDSEPSKGARKRKRSRRNRRKQSMMGAGSEESAAPLEVTPGPISVIKGNVAEKKEESAPQAIKAKPRKGKKRPEADPAGEKQEEKKVSGAAESAPAEKQKSSSKADEATPDSGAEKKSSPRKSGSEKAAVKKVTKKKTARKTATKKTTTKKAVKKAATKKTPKKKSAVKKAARKKSASQ